MKKISLLIGVLLICVSCSTLQYYEKEQGLLSRMPSPVKVVSIGDNGILVIDGRRHFYTIEGKEFASLKPGDTLK